MWPAYPEAPSAPGRPRFWAITAGGAAAGEPITPSLLGTAALILAGVGLTQRR
jgi:hypothetical protein